MEKLPMCRICLAENVRMSVVNRKLHELYEKLTDIPFVTEDSRPILACFICSTKLKQCYQLLRQCLEAEELFAQMMNENYEPNPSINQNRLFRGFKSPIEYISIVDECQTESIAVKEELPAVCEPGLYNVIEPKEEHQSYEIELENLDNSCLDVADLPPHNPESDLEDDEPLLELKTEVEDEEVSKKKRRGRDTKRATVAKKPKPETQRTKLEDTITAEPMKKEKANSKVTRTTQKRTSKPGTYFKCFICQRSFSQKGSLTKHIRIHTGQKPYKCGICQHTFNQKIGLTTHLRKVHTGEKPYKCDICQRSYSSTGNLNIHIRSIHNGEKPYKCDVCQYAFNQKIVLANHIRKHTGENHIRVHNAEKPYKCDICKHTFSKKSNLTKHIRVHTGEKPYKCDVCQRSYSEKSTLTKHVRIHTGQKPHKCDTCQRSFSDKGTLTKHIRIHTGQKPYKCDTCQRSFSDKGNLTKHIRVHTGGKHRIKKYRVDMTEGH